MMILKAITVFDIDGVIRDVGNSYRRAIGDTVEHWTHGKYRPTSKDIDQLKSEGIWNNDWEAAQELIYRYWETQGQGRDHLALKFEELVAFFQSRYLGPNPGQWTGYIQEETLLVGPEYFPTLSGAGIAWGFFSGAPQPEASYVLETRLGLHAPVLIAMEDAPGKPDPTGLIQVVEQLQPQWQGNENPPVIYAGDTVADIYTVAEARTRHPDWQWLAVGVLPPHVQEVPETETAYRMKLETAGAKVVIRNVEELTPEKIADLVRIPDSRL